MKPRPTLLDVFAGCGGMTQGFKDAGFDPVFAVELDQAAAATYAANFGQHIHAGDIAEVENDDIPTVDVMVGGPPCQGFSALGLRNVDDPRNDLWRQYLRFVGAARPEVFVLENVQRFRRSPQHQMLLDEAAHGALREYTLTSASVVASDYGVAQKRPRAIVIGSRIGRIDVPAPTHSREPGLKTLPWEGVRSRIEGLVEKPTRYELPAGRCFPLSLPDGAIVDVPGPYSSEEIHLGRRPTELSLERYDHIPPGGGRHDLPWELQSPCWQRKPQGTTDVMGRMRWESPSLTIRTEFFKPEKGQYLHPEWHARRSNRNVNRPITHLEAARLQDFPDDFRWCGTKTEIARQIGNAVPVGLARAIAVQVKARLEAACARQMEAQA